MLPWFAGVVHAIVAEIVPSLLTTGTPTWVGVLGVEGNPATTKVTRFDGSLSIKLVAVTLTFTKADVEKPVWDHTKFDKSEIVSLLNTPVWFSS